MSPTLCRRFWDINVFWTQWLEFIISEFYMRLQHTSVLITITHSVTDRAGAFASCCHPSLSLWQQREVLWVGSWENSKWGRRKRRKSILPGAEEDVPEQCALMTGWAGRYLEKFRNSLDILYMCRNSLQVRAHVHVHTCMCNIYMHVPHNLGIYAICRLCCTL